MDLGAGLIGGGLVSNDLRVKDVGHENPHLEGFGLISPQGGPQDDGEATSERKGRSMGLHPSGGRDGGGGIS